jgi:hypothetical protein
MKRLPDFEAIPAIRRAPAGRLRACPNLRNSRRRLGGETAKAARGVGGRKRRFAPDGARGRVEETPAPLRRLAPAGNHRRKNPLAASSARRADP